MSKQSGYLVQMKDGRIGRTYHKEKLVNGKIKVYVIADSLDKFSLGTFIQAKEQPRLLCDISSLKPIGMAD